MCGKKVFGLSLAITLLGFAVLLLFLLVATPAHAQPLPQGVDNGACIRCHEDLYFLHDTGKYFCIRESPMRCVDCHGGDPSATTKESAHFDRSAHPIVNEDISKCQECHEDSECGENVAKFDQLAGLKQVKLVSPVPVSGIPNQTTGQPAFEEEQPFRRLLTVEALPLYVISALAVIIYIVYKIRHF